MRGQAGTGGSLSRGEDRRGGRFMLATEHASTAGLLGGYSRVRTGHSFRGRLNEKVGGPQAVWPKGCGEWRSQVVTVGKP